MNCEKKYKLAMVRCDTHAYYFGAMLDECDPLLLMKNNFVVHHYFTDIYNPATLSRINTIPGFEIRNVFDYSVDEAQQFSSAFHGKPKVCATLEEATEGIDAVFISDCDGGGVDHLELAKPFLKKGIPAFVDKPFASTLGDAFKIISMAEEYGVPVLNSSILSQVPAADHFKSRFQEIGDVGLGVVKGVGGAFSQELKGKGVIGEIEERLAYIIHGIALGLNLFGRGVEWVEVMGTLPLEYMHLHLKSGVEILIMNTSTEIFPESCSFFAEAYSKYGAIHSPAIGDSEFVGGGQKIVRLFKEMLMTGRSPVSYDVILEQIAVVEAGQIAHSTGKKVYINDVIKRYKR